VDSVREETKRLLALYRKGLISEDDLVDQLEDAHRLADTSDEPRAPGAQRPSNLIVAVLDGYRAAEESGAETLRRWAELSSDAALAGGLRTIAAREALHAELLAQRVRELGSEPKASVPSWLLDYNAALTNPRASDAERLQAIISQFPDIETALAPLEKTIEALAEDPLTREMLRTIGQDERASLEWLHSAYTSRSARA
jgi:rubrerythrin